MQDMKTSIIISGRRSQVQGLSFHNHFIWSDKSTFWPLIDLVACGEHNGQISKNIKLLISQTAMDLCPGIYTKWWSNIYFMLREQWLLYETLLFSCFISTTFARLIPRRRYGLNELAIEWKIFRIRNILIFYKFQTKRLNTSPIWKIIGLL